MLVYLLAPGDFPSRARLARGQPVVQPVSDEPADRDVDLRFPHQPAVVYDPEQQARERISQVCGLKASKFFNYGSNIELNWSETMERKRRGGDDTRQEDLRILDATPRGIGPRDYERRRAPQRTRPGRA